MNGFESKSISFLILSPHKEGIWRSREWEYLYSNHGNEMCYKQTKTTCASVKEPREVEYHHPPCVTKIHSQMQWIFFARQYIKTQNYHSLRQSF
jgi:hypothetical protein